MLVLGNSLGTTDAVWAQQVPAFSEHFRVLGYDLPGHGGSPAPPGPCTVAGLGALVLALLDSHGIERAAYCGISLGGMIGMWLAAHHPERITTLGLVCTSAYLPPADGWRARAEQVRSAGLAAIAPAIIGRWFTAAYAARHQAVIETFTSGLVATDPAGYAGCCEAIAAMDLRPDLAAVTAPALVIAGADDPATPPDHGAAIARGIPGASLQVIPDAAHLATVSHPAVVTSALLRHLRGPASH